MVQVDCDGVVRESSLSPGRVERLKQRPGVTLPLVPTIAVPTSRSLIACLILADPSETVLEARVMYNHGDATPAPRLLIKPNLSRLFCIREQNYAVVMRGAQRLLCDTTPAALGVTKKKKKLGKKHEG